MSLEPLLRGTRPSLRSRVVEWLWMATAAALLALAALETCGCAGSRAWSAGDYGLAGAYVAATAIDGRQTIDIAAGCREINPIIGECGERVPVAVYFPVMMVGTLGIAALLPAGRWRSTWLGMMTGEEGWTAWSNWRQGEWPGVGR